LGDSQDFAICPINQFGIATDTCHHLFRATQIGDTTLTFNCYEREAKAIAHVLPYSDVNLALHKPVTCSGFENAGTVPANATDGDLTTRWGSLHKDNEWIEVDLEHCYILDSIRLYWETAYATAYEIQLSDDAEHYELAYSTTTCQGKNETILLNALPARYVKILCLQRSSGYGSSLWEIEVYGSGRCDEPETSVEEIVNRQSSIRKFLYHGQIYISRNGAIYTIDGRLLMFEKQ